MSHAAHKALDNLLNRAERAWTRRHDEPWSSVIALRMTEASFKDYVCLPSRHETEQFHAVMRAAERAGAIEIEWDRVAGKDGQVQRIVLVDRDRLARQVGRMPLWDACHEAEQRLSKGPSNASAAELLTAWREGKRPRGIGPERLGDLVDAIRVIETLRGSPSEDRPVRQVSVQLFNDSKRLEALIPVLDYLTGENLPGSPERTADEVLDSLGLIRYPHPALIAGRGRIVFTNGDALRIPAPYLGLAPQSIERIEVGPEARYVITVENFTTFNEICKGKGGAVEGIVMYTAGMPSPAFLSVYGRVIDQLPCTFPVYHWGDIDLGGYRIAEVLSKAANHQGHALCLFNMNPESMPCDFPAWRSLQEREQNWMMIIAQRNGWETERYGIGARPNAYEQEMLPPVLPG